MTMYATDRQVPEPSETPLSDRIAAGFAALPGADDPVTAATPYWTTSLDRPTGFVCVDGARTTTENVAHGLTLSLAALPLGVVLAFVTGRAGSVTVLAAAGLGLGATTLYRVGAQSISRRGTTVVSAVVFVGVLLEVVAVAAAEASVLPGPPPDGPLGFGGAVVHRLGDPSQAGRFLGAAAILLLVALAVTIGSLVWLGNDAVDEGDEGDLDTAYDSAYGDLYAVADAEDPQDAHAAVEVVDGVDIAAEPAAGGADDTTYAPDERRATDAITH